MGASNHHSNDGSRQKITGNGRKEGKTLTFSPSTMKHTKDISFYNINDDFEETQDRSAFVQQKRLSVFEKHLFALVSGYSPTVFILTLSFDRMVTKNELPFDKLLLINFLEDLQLTQFSWRSVLFASNIGYMQYIFNPAYYLVEHFTVPFFVLVLCLIFTLASTMVYCTFGLVKNSLKVMWPLQLLRILTVLMSTVLFMPIIEVFMYAVVCTDHSMDSVHVVCNSSVHNVIRFFAALGATFIIPYGLHMSLLYYDPNPASKSGKASGEFDFFYMLTRVVIIIVDIVAPAGLSFIINLVLFFVLLFFFTTKQPFYSQKLNNLRFGQIMSAALVSICALAKSVMGPIEQEIIYVLIVLAIGFLAIPAGFYLNQYIVDAMKQHIYRKLEAERFIRADMSPEELEIHRSQMYLQEVKVEDVVNANATERKVSVFFLPDWVEISARFVSEAYLNEQSLLFTMEIFDTGFKQYPKCPYLYIMYLEYINAFLQGMQPCRMHLVQSLQRKCNLFLVHKFQLYQHQQNIKQQERSKGIKGSNATSLNFVSYVEYQSMENIVRKYHVQSLHEVRDFWTGLRNAKPAEELAAQLSRISEVVIKTKKQYIALTERFPNSKSVLTLYARFLTLIQADKDMAKQVTETVDDMEGPDAPELPSPDKMRTEGSANGEKSQGSSHTSATNKEALLLRKQREAILDRLHLPVRQFRRKSFLMLALLLAATIAASYLGYKQLDDIRVGVTKFSANLSSRMLSIRIMESLRKMGIATRNNNTALFASAKKSLAEDYHIWVRDVVPAYSFGSATHATMRLSIWTEGEFNIEMMPGNEVAQLVETYVQQIVADADTLFKNINTAYSSTPIRFMLDNGDDMMKFFVDTRNKEIAAFKESVEFLRLIFLIVFIAVAFFTVFITLVNPYIHLTHFTKKESKIIETLCKLPKKNTLQYITLCEEEVELLDSSDLDGKEIDKLDIKGDSKPTRFVLSWRYLLLVLVFVASVAASFALVYTTIDESINVPSIYDTTNYRKTYLLRIQKQILDAAENDATTYVFGEAGVKLIDAYDDVVEINAKLAELYSSRMPPKVSETDKVYVLLRKGACFLGAQELCDKAVYDDSIGFTKTLTTSGLDTQIDAFMYAARSIIEQRNYSMASEHYRLIDKLNGVFYYAFTELLEEYNNESAKSTAETIAIVFALMAVSLLSFGGLGYLGTLPSHNPGFWCTSLQYMRNNEQIMNFIYTVPSAERAKVSELNTFVESAGTSIE